MSGEKSYLKSESRIQGGTKASRASTNVFVRRSKDEPSIFGELKEAETTFKKKAQATAHARKTSQ